jgi:hypothetical protein
MPFMAGKKDKTSFSCTIKGGYTRAQKAEKDKITARSRIIFLMCANVWAVAFATAWVVDAIVKDQSYTIECMHSCQIVINSEECLMSSEKWQKEAKHPVQIRMPPPKNCKYPPPEVSRCKKSCRPGMISQHLGRACQLRRQGDPSGRFTDLDSSRLPR